ncbi:hypothetical protein HUJ04_001502 [Dendroctonus ponderosae]|nr:hypothetical protein HUJ04_001502 [Dendroctonus ponderosae]
MPEFKKKCRQYSVDYFKFGFFPSIADKRLPMCLLCNKVLSNDSMKPSKLEDYLRRCHPEKIAKSGKSHTMGEEFILPAIEEVLKTVLHETVFDVLKRIPLSNNTIKRRIDEMSSDIENFLCNYLQTTHFSIQLDESTLPGNEALLLAYVRFVMDEEIHKELLFAKTLKSCTKGESVFNVLSDFFTEESIPFTNIISVAADGAPAMFGRYRGFISHLKRIIPGIIDLETRAPDLKENLIKYKADIAQLTDLFIKFIDVNLQLQRESLI